MMTCKKPHAHTNFAHPFEFIWTKANFNLRAEVQRNYLSYGWWVVEPLLYMIVYYVVFGVFLNRGEENFTVFLITGLIPWMWFSKSVTSCSNSILAGQNLMLQIGLPTIFFPLIALLQVSIKQLPVFLIAIIFIWLHGFSPDVYWWGLVPVLIVQAMLTITFACTIAAIIPFSRDLGYLVPTGLTLLMFLSGVFYDYRSIASGWQDIFLLNPIAFLLKCYRDIFITATPPDFIVLTYWGMGGAIGCVLVLISYQRLRYVYPRIVME